MSLAIPNSSQFFWGNQSAEAAKYITSDIFARDLIYRVAVIIGYYRPAKITIHPVDNLAGSRWNFLQLFMFHFATFTPTCPEYRMIAGLGGAQKRT